MAINNPYAQYQQNSVYTASSEDLTFMLYNGLIKFIMMSQRAIDDKDIQKSHENIVKAQNIVSEFQITLDMQYEVSKSLALMYDYMKSRLIEANVKKDKAILDEVLGYAKALRDTWAQAMKLAKTHLPNQAVAK